MDWGSIVGEVEGATVDVAVLSQLTNVQSLSLTNVGLSVGSESAEIDLYQSADPPEYTALGGYPPQWTYKIPNAGPPWQTRRFTNVDIFSPTDDEFTFGMNIHRKHAGLLLNATTCLDCSVTIIDTTPDTATMLEGGGNIHDLKIVDSTIDRCPQFRMGTLLSFPQRYLADNRCCSW